MRGRPPTATDPFAHPGATARAHPDGGGVVFRSDAHEPLIEVVDEGKLRTLYFGTGARQSCVCLTEPDRLRLPYTRAMMSFVLLLAQPPQRVLVLGLGGGSVAKFLLRAFNACRIDAVEQSAQVVQVAHDYFGLPRTERCTIHVGDADTFVARAETGAYDAVLVDLYNAAGAARCIRRAAFVHHCRRILQPRGVLAMNLWRGPGSGCRSALAVLARGFSARPWRIPVTSRGNLIALVARDDSAPRPIPGFDAERWTQAVDPTLPLLDYGRALRRQRRWWFRLLPGCG